MLPKTTNNIKEPGTGGGRSSKRRLAIGKDDPFLNIFMQKTASSALSVNADTNARSKSLNPKINGLMGRTGEDTGGSNMSDISYFPNFDGTQDSKVYGAQDSSQSSDDSGSDISSRSSQYNSSQERKPKPEPTVPDNAYWKNKEYWRLPENVRSAIDVAEMKQKHTSFYYKLQTLNDKIFVYRSVFYNRMPEHQRIYMEKKRQRLEEKLRRQKIEFEKEMNVMNKKIKKKMQKQQTYGVNVLNYSHGSPSKSPQKKGEPMFSDKIEGIEMTPVGISTQEMMKQFKKKHGLAEPKPRNMMDRTRIDMSKYAPIKRANSMQTRPLMKRGSSTQMSGKDDDELTEEEEKDTVTKNQINLGGKRPKLSMNINTKFKKDEHEIVEADDKDEQTPLRPICRNEFSANSRNLSNKSSPDIKTRNHIDDLEFNKFEEETNVLTTPQQQEKQVADLAKTSQGGNSTSMQEETTGTASFKVLPKTVQGNVLRLKNQQAHSDFGAKRYSHQAHRTPLNDSREGKSLTNQYRDSSKYQSFKKSLDEQKRKNQYLADKYHLGNLRSVGKNTNKARKRHNGENRALYQSIEVITREPKDSRIKVKKQFYNDASIPMPHIKAYKNNIINMQMKNQVPAYKQQKAAHRQIMPTSTNAQGQFLLHRKSGKPKASDYYTQLPNAFKDQINRAKTSKSVNRVQNYKNSYANVRPSPVL